MTRFPLPRNGRLSRRRLLQGSAGLAATAAWPAGRGAAQTATPTAALPGRPGGSLTWALEQDPLNLVPYLGPTTFQMVGKEGLYDSLLAWDRDLNVVPALAESYETPDDRTYLFHLRRGVRFHDGKELDAEDVKYSIDLFMTPPPPEPPNTWIAVESTEVVDTYTVRINTSKPDPTIPGYLAWGRASGIMPKGANETLNLTVEANGTGPYRLVEFVPNDRVAMERNPDFWRPGLPYLDQLTIRVLPDEQSRLAALRSGEVDGGTFSADTALAVADDPSLTVLSGLISAPRVLQFAIRDGEVPWSDVRVRQAINAAIDRQAIADNVFGGEAVLSGPVPPGYGDWFIPPEELAEDFYVHDPDRARTLLAEAGYADGFGLEILANPTPREFVQTAEIIQAQLAEIGIEVSILPTEGGTLNTIVAQEGSFQGFVTQRGMRPDINGYVNNFWSGDSLYKVWFEGGWRNEEFDRLFEEGLVMTDQAARRPIYRRLQEIVLTEAPNVYLVQPNKFHIVRNRVKNMYVSFTDFLPGLREVWVED